MIALIGDTHGDHNVLASGLAAGRRNPDLRAIIQVGDLGWHRQTQAGFRQVMRDATVPVYWIDGNHEDHRLLDNTQPGTEEIFPNFFFVRRGTVVEIDGRTVAFLGGASSVDKAFRTPMVDWFPDEVITPEQLARLDGVSKVDLLVTHCPPQEVIEVYFNRADLPGWGLPTSWSDPCALMVDELWNRLGRPPLVCGHMHRYVNHDTCTILNINQVYIL